VWTHDTRIVLGFAIMNVMQMLWAFVFPFATEASMRACCFFIFVTWIGLLILHFASVDILRAVLLSPITKRHYEENT